MPTKPVLPARALARSLVGVLVVLLCLGVAPLSASAAGTGYIYGTVTDTRGALLGGVRVEAIRYDDSAARERYVEATTYSDFDGKYSLETLTAGRYYLRFSDPAGDYATRFSSGATRPTSTTGAGTFAVGTGNTLPPTYQLTGAGTSTQVAGYLVKDYGDPSTPEVHPIGDDVEIEARWVANGALAASAISYGGEFELTLDTYGAGAYDVTVKPSRGAQTLGTTFRVTAIAGHRLVMAPRTLESTTPTSSVSGRVTNPGGAVSVGVYTELLELDTDGTIADTARWGQTGSDGSFQLDGIEKGTSYVVRVYSGSRRTYAGGTTLATARRFTWSAGPQSAGTVVLPDESTSNPPVSGTVSLPVGNSEEQPHVSLELWDLDDRAWTEVARVPVAANGTWSTRPATAGTYRLSVESFVSHWARTPEHFARPWFYGTGAVRPQQPGDPGTVRYTAQAPLSGLDVAVPPASQARGTVTAPDGEPTDNFSVTAYRWDPATSTFAYVDESSGWRVDAVGQYLIPLRGPGTYTLELTSYSTGVSQWLGGGIEAPDAPRPDNSFTVSSGAAQTVTRDFAMTEGVRIAGRATVGGSPSGVPLRNAYVELYGDVDPRDPEGGLQYAGEALTDENGRWSAVVRSQRRLTVSVSAPAMQEQWTGGGTTRPTALTDANSIPGTRSRNDVDTALAPRVSDFGAVAGERLSFCYANGFERRGLRSRVVDFPVNVGGRVWDEVVVGSDGALSFGDVADGSRSLPLGSQDNPPMIAPLLGAATTTRETGSAVTYGVSPDGQQLCAVWHQVGTRDRRADTEGTNTFQVLLTRPAASSGRRTGDVDVRFNYDKVSWGRAVTGTDAAARVVGLQAGWSAANGNSAQQLVLDGSGRPDAFTAAGNRSLVSGMRSADRPGRYNFSIVNAGAVLARGGVTGVVRGPSGVVRGATINVCRADGSACSSSTSGSDGRYTVTDLRPAHYEVQAWPASGDLVQQTVPGLTVVAGSTATQDLALQAVRRLPSNATVSTGGRTTTSGTPTLFLGTPVRITVPVPTSGRVPSQARITYGSGSTSNTVPFVRQGDLLVATGLRPESSGTATIRLYDENGVEISAIDVYIDPSGVVTDQYGRLVAGATATLLRSDSANGTFTAVPNGSSQMSPGNRTNPDTTTAQGRFGWDVLPGFYKVRAAATGCATGETPGMSVPPERLDLVLKLECTAPAPTPTVPPVVSGSPVIGQTLRTTVGTWPSRMAPTDRQWLRNGVPITGATGLSYTITAADAGTTLSVLETAERAAYTQENGSGETVVFTPATTRSNGLSVTAISNTTPPPASGTPATGTTPPAAVAPAVATAPVVSGTAASGQRLAASTGTWNQAGLAFAYQWRRDGVAIPGATGAAYTVVPQDAGSALTVLVTGSNGAGSVPVTSAGVPVARLVTTASGSAKLVVKKVKKGKKTKTVKAYVATARVSAPGLVASGPATVVVDKTKKLRATVSKGVATVTLPKLKKGKHTLQVLFAGSKQLAPSSSKATTFTTK